MALFFNGVWHTCTAEGGNRMKISALISFLFIFSFTSPVYSQGFWGQILCNGNITDDIRGQWSGTAGYRYGRLDIEIMNNSSRYRITAVSVRFQGSYDGRDFVRRYDDREIEILPTTSARLWIQTDLQYSDVVVDRIRVFELFGCRE